MSPNVTPRQERAIEALVEGSTDGQAAKRAGVVRRTIIRWRQDATFATALRQARAEALSESLERLRVGASDAVDVLRSVLRITGPGAAKLGDALPARLSAAKALLGSLLSAHSAIQVEEKLAELQARFKEGDR